MSATRKTFVRRSPQRRRWQGPLALAAFVVFGGATVTVLPEQANAACTNFGFEGGFYYQESRLQQPFWSRDSTLMAPSVNAKVKLALSGLTLTSGSVEEVTFSQHRNGEWRVWTLTPSSPVSLAVDASSVDLYVDHDGKWEIAVAFCGDNLTFDYSTAAAAVRYELETPKWRVDSGPDPWEYGVNDADDIASYVVYDAFEELIEGPGTVDFGDTGVASPFDNGLGAMVFQSLRDAHTFTEEDGGCLGCGYALPPGQLAFAAPAGAGFCGPSGRRTCAINGFLAGSYWHTGPYHEFGHVQHQRVQAPLPPYTGSSSNPSTYEFYEGLAIAFELIVAYGYSGSNAGTPDDGEKFIRDVTDLKENTYLMCSSSGADEFYIPWHDVLLSLAWLDSSNYNVVPHARTWLAPLESYWDTAGASGAAYAASLEELESLYCEWEDLQ